MAEPPRSEDAADAATAPGPKRRALAWPPLGPARLALLVGVVALLLLAAAGGVWWWQASSTLARPAPARAAAAAPGLTPSDAAAAPAAPAASAGHLYATVPPAPGSAAIVPLVPSIRPRLADAAISSASTHFALVSPPLAGRADADALLHRLQVETARIRHPTATETSIVSTPQGWRVSWWPFTSQRQADNARSAMTAHHITLEVVDF